MSKVLSYTRTDTAVGGVPSLSLPIAVLNYAADWRVSKNLPEEVILTNLTSAIGFPEKFRISMRQIPDAYKGSPIDASIRSLNKQGIEILVSHTDTAQWTDTEDATFLEAKCPRMNVTFTFPADGSFDADAMLTYIKRSISGLFDTGVVTSSRINAMVRGILKPSGL